MANNEKKNVCVFGAGSFGTAMGFALAYNGHNVRLLCRTQEAADSINVNHRNLKYVKDYELPDNMVGCYNIEEALADVDLIVHAVPMQGSFDYLVERKKHIPDHVPIVSVSKGIHSEKLILMNEVFEEALGKDHPTAYLSGPSFAKEIMQKMVTSVVVASTNPEIAELVQNCFKSSFFRVYVTDDVVGVELGGALKNVFAIGAGMLAGLGFGMNSIAALVTRGCHELRQLVIKVGGRPETLSGLSGIGDLMLTCFGSSSRNRTVGVRLGQGETLQHILDTSLEVAEGVPTTSAALKLLKKHELTLPLMTAIAAVLHGELKPQDALAKMMALPAGHEESHTTELIL
uniref:Glycerol-3-phosphate dehydrogenase [NAD(+)] n=1 Tax=Paramoeba aestuarina TaxID=180227 RepID=A0A7S4UAW0_9EUKA|mmetsp:Transcript_40103/g.63431  ORF Transcript_40103/g.63431 Transcript_40103/m.63431 type:complete len:345 (+) Transcript_40103:75-1109(+)|eukprot:CAMPEP_0201508810 /NCGR_PEP_ID=MMETSP0161_2-20130828/2048_1 /ASSEMBLY_ACC=CAM_ASM_000251 /TAXON_ID=180227 /ORGANISM="Neoparamoeba aestuarina, Strain SoJaBio B1-5/56/2" /LENGTH=344 /DNA_ID=CAMNT_0047903575 /DNA_START=55 /DNA_END=1089 /DNA_ORIENTATION=+